MRRIIEGFIDLCYPLHEGEKDETPFLHKVLFFLLALAFVAWCILG